MLPDALADALGRVVAGVQSEWRRDLERITAESRAATSVAHGGSSSSSSNSTAAWWHLHELCVLVACSRMKLFRRIPGETFVYVVLGLYCWLVVYELHMLQLATGA